jgi:hypothetical protein
MSDEMVLTIAAEDGELTPEILERMHVIAWLRMVADEIEFEGIDRRAFTFREIVAGTCKYIEERIAAAEHREVIRFGEITHLGHGALN